MLLLQYKYKKDDLPNEYEARKGSQFTILLKKKWDKLHELKNIFRYNITNMEEKVISEKYLLQVIKRVPSPPPPSLRGLPSPLCTSSFHLNS